MRQGAVEKVTTRCDFLQRVAVLTNQKTRLLQRVAKIDSHYKCTLQQRAVRSQNAFPQYGPYGLRYYLSSTTRFGYLQCVVKCRNTLSQRIVSLFLSTLC